MRDLIDRQAALDAVINLWADKPFGNPALVEIKDCIEALPPAQPVAKDINVPAKDCISRAQAIEAIKEDKIDLTDPNVVAVFKATGDFEKVETQVMTCDRHIKILKGLPSAPPEQTDCEYCHEDSDGYVRSIEKNSHAWLVRRGRTMKLRVGLNGGHSECDILFCPMCGRRLTDG